MMKKREKGFTLIELVVVVAILGVLAGVAVPRVLGVLQDARNKSHAANLAQIQVAIERHIIVNGNSLAALSPLVTGTIDATIELPINWTAPTGLIQYFGKIPTHPLGGNYTIAFVEIGTSDTFNATADSSTD